MAVFATLIVSCSNDDEMMQTPEKDTSIKVTASVQSATTRAGYSSDNLPPTFYLTITGNGDTDYTNVSMTKGENNLYAPTDGSKLLCDPRGADRLGVDGRVDIRLHHPDLQLAPQPLDQPQQGGRLARAGRGHQVEQKGPALLQLRPQRVGPPVVVRKDADRKSTRLNSSHWS